MDIDFALFSQVVDNYSDERNVSARFYDKAVKTADVSASGLPIFKNVTYVEIRLKDNNTEVFNQPATKEKIERFPREYALYKLSKEKTKKGTPLEQFAFLTVAELATCKNRGIFTVEDLAALDDKKVKALGLENEHNLAQIFMKKAKDNQKISDFAQKEEDYLNKISVLQDEIELLKAKLQEKSNNTPSRAKIRIRSKGEKA